MFRRAWSDDRDTFRVSTTFAHLIFKKDGEIVRRIRKTTFVTLLVLFVALIVSVMTHQTLALSIAFFMPTCLWLRRLVIVSIETDLETNVTDVGSDALFGLLLWWLVRLAAGVLASTDILSQSYRDYAQMLTLIMMLFELSFGIVLIAASIYIVATWIPRYVLPGIYQIVTGTAGGLLLFQCVLLVKNVITTGNYGSAGMLFVLSVLQFILYRESMQPGIACVDNRLDYEFFLGGGIFFIFVNEIGTLPQWMPQMLIALAIFWIAFTPIRIAISLITAKTEPRKPSFEEIVEMQEKELH